MVDISNDVKGICYVIRTDLIEVKGGIRGKREWG